MQEMARTLRLNRVTIFEHVETLIQKGLLCRIPNKARSLTLTPDCNLEAYLTQGSCEPEGPSASAGRFPLAGRIAAGAPLEAIEHQEMLDLGEFFSSSESLFALQVQGDSMIEEHIRPGDYVLVRKTSCAHDGEIVVALLENGEATLKRFFRQGNRFLLQAANPRYSPILADSVCIQGVVKGVLRRL